MQLRILVLVLGVLFTAVFWLLLRMWYMRRLNLLGRLESLHLASSPDEAADELSKPLRERVLIPVVNKLGGVIRQFAPEHHLKKLEDRLILAGYEEKMSSSAWLTIRVLSIVVGTIGGICYLLTTKKPVMIKQALIAALFVMAGVVLPSLFLQTKAKTRQKEIRSSLPNILDLLSVSMEAGLGFDGAISKVTEKMKGTLAEEFKRSLQEIRLGKPRKEVLKNLGERSGLEELKTFIGTVIQADQLGVPIGRVLKVQSTAMRETRRQEVEEKAMKAPVKMLIPLVMFILPTLFVVLIGPAIIQVIEGFTR